MRDRLAAALLGLMLALASGAMGAHAEPRLNVSMSHAAAISSIAFSPDGATLLTGSFDSSLRLWEASSGRELRRFVGHAGAVSKVAFLAGGKTCVSFSVSDHTIRFWDLASASSYKTIDFGKYYGHLDFAVSPDGTRIAYSDKDGKDKDYHDIEYTIVLDASSFKILGRFNTKESGSTKAFSPDGRSLVISHDTDYDSAVRLWEVGAPKEARALAKLGQAGTWTLAYSPEGRTAFVGYTNGTAKLWDTQTGKILKSLPSSDKCLSSSTFSRDGSLVAALSGGNVVVWDVATGKARTTKAFPEANVIAFSPHADSIAVGLKDGSLRAFDAGLEALDLRLGGTASPNAALELGESGGSVVAIAKDGSAALWDLSSLRMKKVLADESLGYFMSKGKRIELPRSLKSRKEIALSPDGKLAAYRSEAWKVSIVDLAGHLPLRDLSLPSWAEFGVREMAIGPDNRTLALIVGNDSKNIDYVIKEAAREKQILLFDMTTGKSRALVGSINQVSAIAFSPDMRTIASGSYGIKDEGVILWDIASGTKRKILDVEDASPWIKALAYSKDGSILAAGDNSGKGFVFDAGSGKKVAELSGRLDSLVFDASGKRLVSGGSEGVLRVWDAASGKEIAASVISPEGDWVAWTPDGFFDGTEAAARNALFVVDGWRTYGIDQFYERYRRPDIIASRLRGDADQAAALAPAGIKLGFASPPSLTLSIKKADGSFGVPADDLALRGLAVVSTQATSWLVTEGSITVRLSAADSGGGLDGVALFYAGKAIAEVSRASAAGSFAADYAVALVEGENALKGVGYSRDRTESSPLEIKVAYRPLKAERPRLFVLAAAADSYRNSKYDLNFALADARGFAAALSPVARKVFEGVDIIELYDKDLTQASLRAALEAIRAKAKPQDAFIFFYAGHGIAVAEGRQNVFYFVLPAVTVMNDADRLKADGFNTAQLRELVASIPASKQMLLVDACNSGAFLEGYAIRGAAEENALAQLQRSSGVALFSSSTEEQFANEVKDLGHGLFTWALIQGLKGEAATKDGKITAASLKAYIDDAVPLLAQKYRGSEQFPLAKISGQDFPIGTR